MAKNIIRTALRFLQNILVVANWWNLNRISKRQGCPVQARHTGCVCPLNILDHQHCEFTSLLILMLKLNPPLSPARLTPEHYRQAKKMRTNTHVLLWPERIQHCSLCMFWRFRFACVCVYVKLYVCVCVSHLVGLSEVVYCTAALPTDGHYHTVKSSTQGRDLSQFQKQNLSHIITLWYLCSP